MRSCIGRCEVVRNTSDTWIDRHSKILCDRTLDNLSILLGLAFCMVLLFCPWYEIDCQNRRYFYWFLTIINRQKILIGLFLYIYVKHLWFDEKISSSAALISIMIVYVEISFARALRQPQCSQMNQPGAKFWDAAVPPKWETRNSRHLPRPVWWIWLRHHSCSLATRRHRDITRSIPGWAN